MPAPSTPAPQDPTHERNWRFCETGIPCEWAESYRPGGFHPVHLGDIFNDRYEIIRKLGDGSFSTVWLSFDSIDRRCVVLKIGVSRLQTRVNLSVRARIRTMVQESTEPKFVVALLDSFSHEGPNGMHPCLVLEPMGPSVSAILNSPQEIKDPRNLKPRRFSKHKTKQILRDVLQGLCFFHARGVVHGDLQPGNILFNICDLDCMPVESLRQELADSRVEVLKRLDGKDDKWAPRYLIVEKSLNDYILSDGDQLVKIADMESAFFESEPPTRIVTPAALRAPETILGCPVSRSIDIWSFGCLVFELLTGMPLFQLDLLGNADDALDDDHLIQLTEILSPLPKDLLNKWPRQSRYFGSDGKRLDSRPGDDSEGSVGSAEGDDDYEDDFEEDDDELFQEDLGPPVPCDSLEKMFRDNRPEDVDEKEEQVILQLLRWILQYDVSKRPTADQLLEHEWFKS